MTLARGRSSSGCGAAVVTSMAERRIASLLAAGCSEAEVAIRLRLESAAVEWTVAKLCRTFDVATAADLAALLRRLSAP